MVRSYMRCVVRLRVRLVAAGGLSRTFRLHRYFTLRVNWCRLLLLTFLVTTSTFNVRFKLYSTWVSDLVCGLLIAEPRKD